jgi:hypothetical protein
VPLKLYNKSIIKSRQIKLPKFDSGLALFLVVIGLFGSLFGMTQGGKVGQIANTFFLKLSRTFEVIGTLMTGTRILFGGGRIVKFGMGTPPEGFIPKSGVIGTVNRQPKMGSGRPMMDLSIDNLPIEFMFSQILSTTTTILVFTVMVLGIISLWYTHKKVIQFNRDDYEVFLSGEIKMLTESALHKIVNFGELEED